MPGKRITELTALTGAETAGDDDLLIFDTNANETKRISRLQLAVGIQDDIATLVPRFVGTRTALKALNTNIHTSVYLTEAGREGVFVFRSGNYSSQVAADTQEGVYIAADDTASSSGAWVRGLDGSLQVEWFGASAYTQAATNSTAIQAAIDASGAAGGGYVEFSAGTYAIDTSLSIPAGVTLRGQGVEITILQRETSLLDAVVKSENFDSLVGTDVNNPSQGVPYNIGLENLTIDGNKEDTSYVAGVNGVEFYAGNVRVHNVMIRDCPGDGWVSEKGTGVTPDGSTQIYEGSLLDLRCAYNNRYGMYVRGPNDQNGHNIIVYQNQNTGILIEDGAAYSASHHWQHVHCYANGRSGTGHGLEANRAVRITDFEASNNAESGLQITAGFYHEITRGRIYGNCRYSGSFQMEVVNPAGYSRFESMLFDDNEKYRTGVGDVLIDGSAITFNGTLRGDSGSTGVGCRITNRGDYFVGDLTVARYDGTNGTAVEVGNGGNVDSIRLNLTVLSCDIGVLFTNQAPRSFGRVTHYANAGQVVTSGTVAHGSGTSWWEIIGYDTDGTENVRQLYGNVEFQNAITNAGTATFTGGVNMSTALVASETDLSAHLALYDTTYGFSITSNNLNLVAAGANSLSVRGTGIDSKVQHNFGSVLSLTNDYTIATLPGSPTVGMIARVTDGDSGLTHGQTAVNSGAGATPYLIWYNGTNWTVIGI